mmetsp:Transcript_43198/g.49800  ORF Transcript_43198/g.49800 Transcript_43198/m.49800 type:complete len:441 (-) Transcript_43198:173-1495(-)
MSTNIHERSSIFTLDISTIDDDVNAPDDEVSDTATVAKNTHQINQQQKQQRQRHDDDEHRVPPPIDSPSSPVRHHPDFASWKRDIDATTDVPKDKKSSVQITDRKTARINKRKQKELQQQLQCAKSDIGDGTSVTTNGTCRSTCDDDDQSSVETTYSSSMLEDNNLSVTDIIGMKKCRSEPFLEGNHSRTLSLERKSRKEKDDAVIRQMHTDRPAVTQIPTPTPTLRTISSVISPPLLPPSPPSSGPPNTKELAAIMFELADLKAWATAATTSMTNNNPSSTLPTLSLSLSTPLLSTFSSSKKQQQPLLQPPLPSTKNESKKEDKIKEQHKHEFKEYKEKKSVQFTHPLITDTIYRPKTPREEVNILFFQEEELLDWENDEETTVRDRFEVVIAEIDETTYDTAPPVISFHNSYSYSFQEDDSVNEYEYEINSNDVDIRH